MTRKQKLVAFLLTLGTLTGSSLVYPGQAVISRYVGTVIAGAVSIAQTLTVTGATALSTLSTSGLATLNSLTVTPGAALIASGTAAAPGLAFSADADGSGTGIIRSTTDTFGFSVNGTNQWNLNSASLAPVASLSENIGTTTLPVQTVYAGSLQGNYAKTLNESSNTNFVTLTVASSTGCSGYIAYTIFAADATNTQLKSGQVFFSAAANSSGTITAAAISDVNTQNPCTSGTLTNTMTADATVANAWTLGANAASSLTQTTLAVRYRVVFAGTNCTVTGL